MLSALDASPDVTSIDVLGMNWNGRADLHVDFADRTLVRRCCTKCVVHPTLNERYGTEWSAPMVLSVGVAACACVFALGRKVHRRVRHS